MDPCSILGDSPNHFLIKIGPIADPIPLEENIQSLVEKCRNLDEKKMRIMQVLVVSYSKSPDLATSFVSVGVLHALGMSKDVEKAYLWAKGLDESETFIHHFDIGKSLAEYFA